MRAKSAFSAKRDTLEARAWYVRSAPPRGRKQPLAPSSVVAEMGHGPYERYFVALR